MLYQAVYARSAIILTIICAASLLPLLVLYLEFRGIPFCNEAYWFYIAKLYGSYFLFPIFGTIAAIFLLVPFAVLMLVLQVENFRPILRYAAVALIGLVTIASLIEFTGSPHAVFEVSPQALRSGNGQKFFNKLKTACTSDFAYKGKYDGVEGSYQYDLGDAKSSGLSYSHFVYYVAVPAQVALLVSLLVPRHRGFDSFRSA